MKIYFRLGWIQSGAKLQKAFKSASAQSLFYEYVQRISKFMPCEVSGVTSQPPVKEPNAKIWLCDPSPGSKMLSSEALSKLAGNLQDSGARELHLVIGGPDGFSKKEIQRWNPDLRWSFGPLTFPHELAAVVASEQIYRAFTILRHLPYHCGH